MHIPRNPNGDDCPQLNQYLVHDLYTKVLDIYKLSQNEVYYNASNIQGIARHIIEMTRYIDRYFDT